MQCQNPGEPTFLKQGASFAPKDAQVVHILCFPRKREGPLRSSSVGGGSFIPIVVAICFGSNSLQSDGKLKVPSI